jgi:hypothetical protein
LINYGLQYTMLINFPIGFFISTPPHAYTHCLTVVLTQKFDRRMQNSIVVHVCAMNFFYVFIVPGPILRHLGEFGKIRLLPGGNTHFLLEGGQYGYLEDGL